ncbi:type II CAAX endopeptidase family protein [Clostridium sp. OS1-26]|uniref:CPBP family intramembrane glutamic endopeptidase n=1 Tax=Clostridium sp. OS1-26 TaxID=3070681 RepID=UPI0027E0C657|nr:type II CAAX endopeptidase family protein [Clostridium sp. OS1-26]WML34965.1 type II CAAX endopeptidase family protein [Clostridium sp. OS1-26]
MNLSLFKEIKTRHLFLKMFYATILSIVILILYKKVFNGTLRDDNIEFIAAVITSLFFVLILQFMRQNKITLMQIIGKPSSKKFILEVPLTWIITIIGGIGAMLAVIFIVYSANPNLLNSVNSNFVSKPSIYSTPFTVVIGFIYGVIIAPITEELTFRGILLNRFHNKYGVTKAIIYSSLIFMIVHTKVNPLLFFVGVSCSILAYKYDSLIPSILLHAVNNLIVHLRDLMTPSNSSSTGIFNPNLGVFILGVVLLSIYLLYIYKNYPKRNLLNVNNDYIKHI